MAPTPATLVQNALNTWVPDYDLVLIILNDRASAAAGAAAFRSSRWARAGTVMAHEFGHGTGGLADEYCTARHVHRR